MSFGVQGVSASLGAAQGDASTGLRPFANLDLTSDQRSQIRQILTTARSAGTSEAQMQNQINAVLTPQQQQLQTDQQQQGQAGHTGHHHHHHHGGGSSSAASATASSTTTDPWDPDQTDTSGTS